MHLSNTQTDLNEIFGLIQISGSQSADFLQGQLSCDIQEVTPHESRLGVHCNAKGRVLFSFRIFYQASNYYLLLPQSMVSFAIDDLKKYALFYDVQLNAVSHLWHMRGLSGQTLEKSLVECLDKTALSLNQVYQYQEAILLTLPGVIFRVIEIHPAALNENPYIPIDTTASSNDWQYWDIQSGIACVYPSTRELFTPHHLYYHMNDGVSFTKGCYTGQEVIARMQYLGKLKHQLYRLTIPYQASLTPGSSIINEDNRPQGTVIMHTLSADHTPATQHVLASINTAAITQPLWTHGTRITQIEAL